jgi:hypothetical protein
MEDMLALVPEDQLPGSFFSGHFLHCLPMDMQGHLAVMDFKYPMSVPSGQSDVVASKVQYSARLSKVGHVLGGIIYDKIC